LLREEEPQKMDLKQVIRSIKDFPRKGIVFRDITPILANPTAFRYCVDALTSYCRRKRPEAIVGIESRGFLLGSPVAYELNLPFVPVRKLGKLPGEKISESYELEYGTQVLEIHTDAISNGQSVVIVDDLLATGGTALATAKLVQRLGGRVLGYGFVVELSFLRGREKISDYDVFVLTSFSSEE
jgi:adenine phosphoribosyltransferase